MTATDPYWRLRPAAPTPEDEICHCQRLTGVILIDLLGDNPLHCLECKGELPPELLGIGQALTEKIAFWLSVYDSLYRLWVASGEYESWAAARLADPNGEVNQEGREIIEQLNVLLPAYYWWFQNESAADHPPLSQCPICDRVLEPLRDGCWLACASCRIIM